MSKSSHKNAKYTAQAKIYNRHFPDLNDFDPKDCQIGLSCEREIWENADKPPKECVGCKHYGKFIVPLCRIEIETSQYIRNSPHLKYFIRFYYFNSYGDLVRWPRIYGWHPSKCKRGFKNGKELYEYFNVSSWKCEGCEFCTSFGIFPFNVYRCKVKTQIDKIFKRVNSVMNYRHHD